MKRYVLFLSCFVAATFVSGVSAKAQSSIIADGDFESSVVDESIVVPADKGGDLLNKWRLVVKPVSVGSGTVIDDETDVFEGSKSLKIRLENIDYRYRFFLAQEMENIAPKKYKLSFQMKADKANIPVRVDFIDIAVGATNGGTDISKSPVTTATEWTKYEVTLDLSGETAAKAMMRLAFRFNCTSGGSVQNEPVTYWLDQVVLEEDRGTSNIPSLNGEVSLPFYAAGNSVRFPGLEESAEVLVYGATGALVLSVVVSPGQSVAVPYAGCYVVCVKTSAGTVSGKVIIR